MADIHLVQNVGNLSPDGSPRMPNGAHGVGDVLPYSFAREQCKILGNNPHFTPQAGDFPIVKASQIAVLESNGSTSRSHFSRDQLDHRALSGACLSDKKDEIAFLDA
jgi:hypothetical protein